MIKTSEDIAKSIMKLPEGQLKTTALSSLALLNTWHQNVNLFNTTTAYLIGDMTLYIETLERYSTELDNTLTDIFEMAEKKAEEQRKQKEEIMKRKHPESYIK